MTTQRINQLGPANDALPAYRFLEALKVLPYVEAIYLFGSRARGDHAPRADIDLAISCPTADAQDWQAILDIVDNADTLLEIDCIRLDREPLHSRLRLLIERDKRVIYERSA